MAEPQMDLHRLRKGDAMSDTWDRRFLELAKHISGWSKDPSTKVGSVLVQERNLVVGIGYNGFPRGVRDEEHRYESRELKYQFVVHAEVNAILMAGKEAQASTLYTWPAIIFPNICNECAKFAIQAGVHNIISYEPDPNDPRAARWNQSGSYALAMLNEAGVGVFTIKQEVGVRYASD